MDRLGRLLIAEVGRNLTNGGKPSVPAGGELLWRWFGELAGERRWTMAGPDPITHGDIAAYARQARWPIEPRHAAILRGMDDAFMEYWRNRQAQGVKGSMGRPAVSARPMTGALFDAMFGG